MVNIEDTNINYLVTYYNALVNMQERHKYGGMRHETYMKHYEKLDESLNDMEKRILERMYEPDKMI